MTIDKKMIRAILEPSTDALTVVQYCALIDPATWKGRAEKMERGEMRSFHAGWVARAQDTLEGLLNTKGDTR